MIIEIVKFNLLFLGVFIVLWLIGFGAARALSPRVLQPYAVLLAPVWGTALIIALLTPISLVGVPLIYANWIVYVVALGVALVFPLRDNTTASDSRGALGGVKVLGVVLALSAVGGSMVLFSSSGMSFDSVRGSTDFMAYWVTSDYVNHFGGRLEDYLQQGIFKSSDIYAHLSYYERWGTIVFLGFFSSLVSSDEIYVLINPLILAGKANLILLFAAISLRSKLIVYPVVILLSFASITYSNLYFTYLSYAVALPVAVLATWSVRIFLKDIETPSWAALVGIGLLIGVSLVSHSVAFVSLCFVLSLLFAEFLVQHWRRIPKTLVANWRRIALVAAFVLPYVAVYGKRVLGVVLTAAAESKWGWEWERLPTIQDVVALGNTLGFNQLGPVFPTFVQIILAAIAIMALILGARRLESGTMVIAFVAFAAVSLPRYFYEYYVSHNLIASHSIAKLIFSFSDFFLFLITIGAWEYFRGISVRHLEKAIFGLWGVAALKFLSLTTPLPIFYGSELVNLLRGEKRDATFYVNIPDFRFFSQQLLFGPILRNGDKLVSGVQQLRETSACSKTMLVAWEGGEALHGEVLSKLGRYSLGYPPSALDFTRSPGAISLVSGFNYWEGSFRWLEKSATLFLMPVVLSDSSLTSYRLRISAIGIVDHLRKVHRKLSAKMKVDLTINGVFRTSFELENGENEVVVDIPGSAVAICDSFLLIEFNAPYEVSGVDFGTTDTKKTSWGIRKIELMPVSPPVRISRGNSLSFGVRTIIERGNCALDAVDGKPINGNQARIFGGDDVVLVGWAADIPTGAVPKKLFLELDGRETIRVDSFRGLQRPDVATAQGKPALVAPDGGAGLAMHGTLLTT